MNILVTILARGGSKGVPGKHLKKIGNKPLIAWTVEQAIKWGKGDIVVSSDDPAIRAYCYYNYIAHTHAREINILNRTASLCQDESPKVPAIRHTLVKMEKRYNTKYDVIIDLDATAPLRRIQDIEACYQKFIEKRPPTLFSVCHGPNPRWNMVERKQDGSLDLCIPEDYWNKGIRARQGIKQETWCVNSNIYIYDREFLLDESNDSCLVPDKTEIYVMPRLTLHHIDEEQDVPVVELLLSFLEK